MITVTSAANAQVSKLCQENECYAITLNIKGGGCAGFEYDWGTAKKKNSVPMTLLLNVTVVRCQWAQTVKCS